MNRVFKDQLSTPIILTQAYWVLTDARTRLKPRRVSNLPDASDGCANQGERAILKNELSSMRN
ncbi:MAG: hypothetical protein RM347_015630 [Nostoc sp. ChiQUE02]|uniref:hypothetical protein n=1 Tax=Nostoc sp. ChiQUE02 TaxID=3075377 RepID=UPI002AD47D29|nr:hypothetical protein [Nostoc sp. ChiQUE02]MDZ8232461.1 hypothetical protein [Nostoc sp. ChiQUE02]